jgi:hypothetical protein
MTDHVTVPRPVGGNQSHRGRDADDDKQWKRQNQEMADDETRGED